LVIYRACLCPCGWLWNFLIPIPSHSSNKSAKELQTSRKDLHLTFISSHYPNPGTPSIPGEPKDLRRKRSTIQASSLEGAKVGPRTTESSTFTMGKPVDFASTLNGVMWFQVAVASIFISLRMYTRYYIVRKVGWDDLLMIVNLVRI
jgi:hypothetical protein